MSALADGLDEARRHLWRSALESFTAAIDADLHDPRPVFAAAICLLELGFPERAVVMLETAGLEPGLHVSWLTAAARLALGDTHGARRQAESLPDALRARVEAHAALQEGAFSEGIAALIRAHRLSRGGAPLHCL